MLVVFGINSIVALLININKCVHLSLKNVALVCYLVV